MALVVAFLVVLLALMYLGWRRRKTRQSGIAAPSAVPADLGEVIERAEGKYVATTRSGDPLDRIAVHGLGFRGTTTVTVTEAGLLVQLPDTEFWIPSADLLDTRRATWTIDRVVEEGGLQLIQWRLGETLVDSYFRMTEPNDFERAIERLLAERTPA